MLDECCVLHPSLSQSYVARPMADVIVVMYVVYVASFFVSSFWNLLVGRILKLCFMHPLASTRTPSLRAACTACTSYTSYILYIVYYILPSYYVFGVCIHYFPLYNTYTAMQQPWHSSIHENRSGQMPPVRNTPVWLTSCTLIHIRKQSMVTMPKK